MSKQRAFTLVELLVVIGVIAILVAFLMPALTRARDAASRTQCISNTRQLTFAVLNYTTEWRGHFPPNFSTGYDYGGWAPMIARYMNVSDPNNIPITSAYYCPVPAYGQYTTKGRFMYAMNHDHREYYRKITQVNNASMTFVFTEASHLYDARNIADWIERALLGYTSAPNRATPAHGGKGFPISYLDGHAEFFVPQEKVTLANLSFYKTDRRFPWTHKIFWGWTGSYSGKSRWYGGNTAPHNP